MITLYALRISGASTHLCLELTASDLTGLRCILVPSVKSLTQHSVIHINTHNMDFIYNKVYMEEVGQCDCGCISEGLWVVLSERR